MPALRILVLVRHGQYHRDPERLTSLGRKQAYRTARALAGLEVTRVHSSTMHRALETATFIADQLGKRVHRSELLCEGLLPMDRALARRILGRSASSRERADQRRAMARSRRRADRAFEVLFAPPRRGTRTDVVVSHGNVIRYWLCRALRLPILRWTQLDAFNCSITTLSVDADGNCRLLGFGDVGHLPPSQRTC